MAESLIRRYHLDMEMKIGAKHILVDSKDQAEKLKDQIDKGEFFEILAKEHSKDGSAQNGGDLGSFGRGEMVKPFESAAFNLQPGEVSRPVKTQFGYHLIKRYK